MAIKNNTPNQPFDRIEVVEFSYKKDFRQSPKPTLFYRWQKVHIDSSGLKSRSDEPIQERFIKDVNELIQNDVIAGHSDTLNAFLAIQKFIAKDIKETTGLDSIFEED